MATIAIHSPNGQTTVESTRACTPRLSFTLLFTAEICCWHRQAAHKGLSPGQRHLHFVIDSKDLLLATRSSSGCRSSTPSQAPHLCCSWLWATAIGQLI